LKEKRGNAGHQPNEWAKKRGGGGEYQIKGILPLFVKRKGAGLQMPMGGFGRRSLGFIISGGKGKREEKRSFYL